jgi:hypothetical protein
MECRWTQMLPMPPFRDMEKFEGLVAPLIAGAVEKVGQEKFPSEWKLTAPQTEQAL